MKEVIYLCNFPPREIEFYALEMEMLFGVPHNEKYFTSNRVIDPSRSPFIKEALEVVFKEKTLEEVLERIEEKEISCEEFKVIYVKTEEKSTTYEERLEALRKVGYKIKGIPNIHHPKAIYAITNMDGYWYFGIYKKNSFSWHIHDKKPFTYSNSLPIRMARALVNIACGNDYSLKLVDPCCGVGTVLIEALDMGFNAKGFDKNKVICTQARRNLEFFGFEDIVKGISIQEVEEKFDVAIIDLPYNHFSPITYEEQVDIISNASRISNKLILVTFEEMEREVENCNFKISNKATFSKGKFVRHIYICKKEIV